MPSIMNQYELWPTRTLYYRRHMVETNLLQSTKGRYRRLAWLEFLAGMNVVVMHTVMCTNCLCNIPLGDWQWHNDDGSVKEVIRFECDVDKLSISWSAAGCKSRPLDWSYGGYENCFTLAGGDSKRILRWRPSTRHPLFDDDHVVWKPYNTCNERVLDC